MIEVACKCGGRLEVREASAGKQVRCPTCGEVHKIPRNGAGETASVGKSQHETKDGVTPLLTADGSAVSAGAKIGQYVLRRKIGQGAMGEVWLGHDLTLRRDAAIKLLPESLAGNPERLARFLREARSAAKLNHPNVVTVHQIGKSGKLVYLAMEFVDGGSCEELVAAKGPPPWKTACQVIRDAAAGLSAAHAADIVHRDVKPANLLRSSGGATKVADFGIARSLLEPGKLTQDHSRLGTPLYMAPEQWKGEEVDPRTDLYSLTLSLYYLLGGEPPFNAPSPAALGYQHRYEPLPNINETSNDIPKSISAILQKGSQKNPKDRYSTAEQLILDLDRVLGNAGGSRPDGKSEAIPALRTGARRPRPRPRRSSLTALLVVGFLSLLGYVIDIVNDKGTITIEGADPQLTIKLDGDPIHLEQLKQPLTLRTGDHELLVVYGEMTVQTNSFTIRRGEDRVLRIEYKPDHSSDDESRIGDGSDWGLQFDGELSYATIPTFRYRGEYPITVEVIATPAQLHNRFANAFSNYPTFCMELSPDNHWHWQVIGDNCVIARSRHPAVVGARYHLAGTIDSQTISLFVNGSLQLPRYRVEGELKGNANPIFMGAGNKENEKLISPFDGIIHEVRISRGVRYSADFDPPESLTSDDRTVVCIPLTEGSGYIAHDTSGSHHGADIRGAKWVKSPPNRIEQLEETVFQTRTTILFKIPWGLSGQGSIDYPLLTPQLVTPSGVMEIAVIHGYDDSGNRGMHAILQDAEGKTLQSWFTKSREVLTFRSSVRDGLAYRLVLEDGDTKNGNCGDVSVSVAPEYLPSTPWSVKFYAWDQEKMGDVAAMWTEAGWQQLVQSEPILAANLDVLTFDTWNADRPRLLPDSIPMEYFGLVANTSFEVPAGRYAFLVDADDGIRIYVDEKKLFEQWTCCANASPEIDLTAGPHTLTVEYFQSWGAQSLHLWLVRVAD